MRNGAGYRVELRDVLGSRLLPFYYGSVAKSVKGGDSKSLWFDVATLQVRTLPPPLNLLEMVFLFKARLNFPNKHKEF